MNRPDGWIGSSPMTVTVQVVLSVGCDLTISRVYG